jgi:hypothetical protein
LQDPPAHKHVFSGTRREREGIRRVPSRTWLILIDDSTRTGNSGLIIRQIWRASLSMARKILYYCYSRIPEYTPEIRTSY